MDQAKLLKRVEQTIKSSDYSNRKKRRMLRKLKRSRVRELVLDEVIAQAYHSDVITIQEGDPRIDWDGLIEFLERLLPLIVKLIGLFG